MGQKRCISKFLLTLSLFLAFHSIAFARKPSPQLSLFEDDSGTFDLVTALADDPDQLVAEGNLLEKVIGDDLAAHPEEGEPSVASDSDHEADALAVQTESFHAKWRRLLVQQAAKFVTGNGGKAHRIIMTAVRTTAIGLLTGWKVGVFDLSGFGRAVVAGLSGGMSGTFQWFNKQYQDDLMLKGRLARLLPTRYKARKDGKWVDQFERPKKSLTFLEAAGWFISTEVAFLVLPRLAIYALTGHSMHDYGQLESIIGSTSLIALKSGASQGMIEIGMAIHKKRALLDQKRDENLAQATADAGAMGNSLVSVAMAYTNMRLTPEARRIANRFFGSYFMVGAAYAVWNAVRYLRTEHSAHEKAAEAPANCEQLLLF